MKSLLHRLPQHLLPKVPFLDRRFPLVLVLCCNRTLFSARSPPAFFVGLWVPSIHSLGTLIVSPLANDVAERESVMT